MEGVEFINEMGCFKLDTFTERATGFSTPYWPHLSDLEKGTHVPAFRTEGEISSDSNTDVGGIKAKLLMRGDTFGTYHDLLTPESYGKIQGRLLTECEAQIDLLFHSIMTTMNDIFSPTTPHTVQAGGELYDANGNQIYGAGDQIKILDVDKASYGADHKLPPRELFERMGTERYTVAYDAQGNEVYVYNQEIESDPNTWYNVGNVQLNKDLTKQVTLLPAFTQNGAVNYQLGEDLAKEWEKQGLHISPDDQYPCTFQGFYDKIIGKLGTDGSIYKSSRDTLTNTISSIDNNRQQIMGVSSDEELTNLIQYQSAYNAASRYMTVISQMTELIVTGLI
jgi:flagellar hook-associated protein 1 FlgK